MHISPACSGELCQPVRWRQRGKNSWWVKIRCPDCDHVRSGVFGRASVEAFDGELDRGTASLLRALRSLTQVNMSVDLERLHAALEADALLPEDFVL